MSDVNVKILFVDKGMEIMDAFSREVQDLKAHVTFDINSLIELLEREKNLADIQYENNCYRLSNYESNTNIESEIARLLEKCNRLHSLSYQTTIRMDELNAELTLIYLQITDSITSCNQIMGEYIRKLNRINTYGNRDFGIDGSNSAEYFVVIVDSRRYPQTAEHIKMAQTMGLPEFVTIGRSQAAERRKASLANIRVRHIYDRDEWPMAVFEEGGLGANVVYLDGHDNRGSGSSISWQMRGLSDGTRVRVRVI